MWSAPRSRRSIGCGEPGWCSLVTSALGMLALLGCNFSDVVEIGRDEAGGTPGAVAWMAMGGLGGLGGVGGFGGVGASAAGGAASDPCGVGVQTGQIWVDVEPSPTPLVRGSGGPLQFGEYRLRWLTEHGIGTCFAAETLAQTLAFRDQGHGTVISDYVGGAHFAASFMFSSAENRIDIRPTCTDPRGPMSEEGSFGPFETFTATAESLVLVSEACSYSAAYEFMPIPTR